MTNWRETVTLIDDEMKHEADYSFQLPITINTSATTVVGLEQFLITKSWESNEMFDIRLETFEGEKQISWFHWQELWNSIKTEKNLKFAIFASGMTKWYYGDFIEVFKESTAQPINIVLKRLNETLSAAIYKTWSPSTLPDEHLPKFEIINNKIILKSKEIKYSEIFQKKWRYHQPKKRLSHASYWEPPYRILTSYDFWMYASTTALMKRIGVKFLKYEELTYNTTDEPVKVRVDVPARQYLPYEGEKLMDNHPWANKETIMLNHLMTKPNKMYSNAKHVQVPLPPCNALTEAMIVKMVKNVSNDFVKFSLNLKEERIEIVTKGAFTFTASDFVKRILGLQNSLSKGTASSLSIPIKLQLYPYNSDSLWIHCDLIESNQERLSILRRIPCTDELVDYSYPIFHRILKTSNISQVNIKVTLPFSSKPIKLLGRTSSIFQLVFMKSI